MLPSASAPAASKSARASSLAPALSQSAAASSASKLQLIPDRRPPWINRRLPCSSPCAEPLSSSELPPCDVSSELSMEPTKYCYRSFPAGHFLRSLSELSEAISSSSQPACEPNHPRYLQVLTLQLIYTAWMILHMSDQLRRKKIILSTSVNR